jgi:hypothetical protein
LEKLEKLNVFSIPPVNLWSIQMSVKNASDWATTTGNATFGFGKFSNVPMAAFWWAFSY